MVRKFGSIEEMKSYLKLSEFETENTQKIDKNLEILWKKFKEKELFLKLNKKTGHDAYCMLRNSYALAENATNLICLVELNSEKGDLKDFGVQKEDLVLLVCMAYNLYLEKIGDFFKIILDVEKLCQKKRSFYNALEIIEALEKLLSRPDVFKYINRDLRNAIAHADFNIIEDSIIYNREKKHKQRCNHVVLNLEQLFQATISLNRLVVMIFKKIEKDLDPYLDEERLEKDSQSFEIQKKKIIDEQKRKK